ncbi:hypothetical protein [Cellulomonas rhizosphaerae]|uniref:Uncharacterized protein n=1 Tax=Cellulomonas rhizosphaerae TaxID=2293719 RepID=A0A413RJI6_9CELL|nr:hypothetical protein [Cellulomonas rhizosphaerae]RHA38696.1 hypothetical protein D1825_13255 [Cellulomonas rhizosphaerae]
MTYDEQVAAAMQDPTVVRAREVMAEARAAFDEADHANRRHQCAPADWAAASGRLDTATAAYNRALTAATVRTAEGTRP